MTSRKVGSSSTTSTRTWREAPGVAWGFGVEFDVSGVASWSGYCVKPFTVWAIDFGRRFNGTLVRCSPERKSPAERVSALQCRVERLVEAQLHVDLADRFRRSVRPGDHLCGIAWHQVEDHEHQTGLPDSSEWPGGPMLDPDGSVARVVRWRPGDGAGYCSACARIRTVGAARRAHSGSRGVST